MDRKVTTASTLSVQVVTGANFVSPREMAMVETVSKIAKTMNGTANTLVLICISQISILEETCTTLTPRKTRKEVNVRPQRAVQVDIMSRDII